MSFGAPGWLLLMALASASLAALIWWAAWREEARGRFGRQAPRRAPAYVPPALLLAALVLAVVAAARPQWGHKETEVSAQGIDLVIVLDISRSMQAQDMQPDRLGVARAEIDGLLAQMTGDRAGLVVFAGAPFVRSPLTTDIAALREIVSSVDQEFGLVPPGSDLGDAIVRAAELLRTAEARSSVFDMQMTVQAAGQSVAITGSGSMRGQDSAKMTMRTSGGGVDVAFDMRMLRESGSLVMYMRSASLRAALPAGKTWMRLDLDIAAAKLGLDYSELIDWLRRSQVRPRRVFVTHGEPSAADALRRRLKDELGLDALVPDHGGSYPLP